MRLKFEGRMLDGFSLRLNRKKRNAIKHSLLYVFITMFTIVAYIGLWFASVFMMLLPFDILANTRIRPHSISYWIWAMLFLSVDFIWIIFLTARNVYLFKHQNKINLDFVMSELGSLMALAWLIYLLWNGETPLQ
jgi:hypothetical protein